MGQIRVPVTTCLYGEFLDLEGLPPILAVKPDPFRGVVEVTLDVPDMADCEADCLIRTVDGEVVNVQLVPRIPFHDPVLSRLIDRLLERAQEQLPAPNADAWETEMINQWAKEQARSREGMTEEC